MKRLILAMALLGGVHGVHAAGSMHYLDAKVDVYDKASLQSGAAVFANYCLSCHAMSYMRYNRMAKDLDLSDEQVASNMMFAADKVVEPMTVAMQPGAAEQWFGVAPPDLSVIARARGANYLYSYLVSFYEDDNPARQFGVNNVVLAGSAMPHVLWPLQGHQRRVNEKVEGTISSDEVTGLSASGNEILVHRAVTLEDGEKVQAVDRLQVSTPGSLAPGEYRAKIRDLVTFLVYAAEPAQLERRAIGLWVLAFLAVLFVLARMLYKEYWRDVH